MDDEVEKYKRAVHETAIKKDDQIIHQLGKKLKVSRNAKLPSIFANDGLDCIFLIF